MEQDHWSWALTLLLASISRNLARTCGPMDLQQLLLRLWRAWTVKLSSWCLKTEGQVMPGRCSGQDRLLGRCHAASDVCAGACCAICPSAGGMLAKVTGDLNMVEVTRHMVAHLLSAAVPSSWSSLSGVRYQSLHIASRSSGGRTSVAVSRHCMADTCMRRKPWSGSKSGGRGEGSQSGASCTAACSSLHTMQIRSGPWPHSQKQSPGPWIDHARWSWSSWRCCCAIRAAHAAHAYCLLTK